MTRWLAVAIFVAAISPSVFADPVLRWAPTDAAVPIEGEITLSVMLDEAVPVRTVELYIEYDASLVTSISGGPGALFNGFNLFQGFEEVDPENPGEWHGYCVILGATQWTTGPGELFRWRIRGSAEGVCSVTTSELTLLPPGGGNYSDTTLPNSTLTIVDLTSVPPLTASGLAVLALPNPFNPRTTLCFTLSAATHAAVAIYDARGMEVVRLVDELLDAGAHTVDWDGRDAFGASMPSGTYFCRLTASWGTQTAKLQLVR
jgi:hypothetical protein